MQNLFLEKYWLTFDDKSAYPLGVGVTAYSVTDAEKILAEHLFKHGQVPPFQIKIIKSLDELEQNHVLPNIGIITFRGIWFPWIGIIHR